MKKISIFYCPRIQDHTCIACMKCFKGIREKHGEFAWHEEDIEIVSMTDNATGRELLAATSNVLRMYKDVPSRFDAWDIDSMYVETPVDLGDSAATIEVVASGPLVGILGFGLIVAGAVLIFKQVEALVNLMNNALAFFNGSFLR